MVEKLEVFGTNPLPRFGHTITYIAKGKTILFGGATGDTGRYSITGDTFAFDLVARFWKKVETTGSSPSPRAAHASVAVEVNQLVVYGGATGGGSLASDDLYLLDLRANDDTGMWTIVPVIGATPSRRYGHSLTYSRPYLVVYGGNTGQEPVNDFWCLNVEKSPFSWIKLECKNEVPQARVYHSSAQCQQGSANGMIVIFGGRAGDTAALNDTWGLRRHRNGLWDWVRAPYKPEKDQPSARYQHTSLFLGNLMIVIGGRTNNVGEQLTLEVYDTETSEWYKFQCMQRFRHASWIVDSAIYVYGGFEHDSPNVPTDALTKINLLKVLQNNESLVNKINSLSPSSPINRQGSNPGNSTPTMDGRGNQNNMGNQQGARAGGPGQQQQVAKPIGPNGKFQGLNKQPTGGTAQQGQQNQQQLQQQNSLTFQQNQLQNLQQPPRLQDKNNNTFKIGTQAVLVEEIKYNDDIKYKKIQIEDGIRKSIAQNGLSKNLPYDSMIHNQFISGLLQPKNYINLPENAKFMFSSEQIVLLCDYAQKVLEEQPMVLRLRAPIKIFGDIHGQYSDLMRFFDLWGSPCDGGKDGDIESFDYLFLGDFVDRGSHSLETICLLLALKIKYPEQIHLIRGNHEDKWINNGFGFSDECAQRLGEDPTDEDSVFNRVNRLFEWLPLAAIIEEKIICLHGGIGSSLNYVEEIEQLERPLEVIHEVSTLEQQLVVDILWSDPTDSDTELGIHPNTIRDPAGTGNIVKFGPDRVQNFLNNNNLGLIIRAHECVMDGFERFAGGALITVFSATDYCGKHKNAGAVLILKTNLEIIPKLIYPQNVTTNNWLEDEETLKKRPPTPPRWKNTLPRKSSDY